MTTPQQQGWEERFREIMPKTSEETMDYGQFCAVRDLIHEILAQKEAENQKAFLYYKKVNSDIGNAILYALECENYNYLKDYAEALHNPDIPSFDDVIKHRVLEGKRELVKEMVEVVKEANNLRQAKIDGKEDWNMAMEQCAAKFDAVISTLTAIAEKHNVQL